MSRTRDNKAQLTLGGLQQKVARLAFVGEAGGAQDAVGQARSAHGNLARVLVVQDGAGVELETVGRVE